MTFTIERKRRRIGKAPLTKAAPATLRPMSRVEIAGSIAEIKEQARRLRPPLNQKPDAFHEDKSELVRAIERLEDAVRQNRQIRE